MITLVYKKKFKTLPLQTNDFKNPIIVVQVQRNI